ncbi:hypothetical protein BOX15_Mlig024680g5 [Macrostomum lignano]|uniref:Uncharacterized protein n=1 Tax=Macrostomum lignano TaxID=282301 RepID=A0A267DI78_9PLAT|nr:hypothetical protein BOX15_Mlig024680g5 [Macrostomum lignano]
MSRSDPSAEMPQVEKLPAAERIRLAKKRRAQQLKRYAQWSKAMDKKGHQVRNLTGDDPSRMVRFSQNIVLLEAAARGDIDEVRSLLKSGVNPNAANDDGLTALHQCCIDNSEAMCRLLLEFNADVNARDTEQWTPLHAAATCGHIAICRLLVNSGAELLAVNADGNMPYDICEESGTLDYIEGEMARRGITQQQIDDTRLVPEKRMLQDVTRIFEQSESKAACRQQFNKLDSQGANLLHVACASGFLSVIVYLLDQVRVPSTPATRTAGRPCMWPLAGASWTPLKLWPPGAPTWTLAPPLGRPSTTCARTRRSGNAWIQSRRRRSCSG